MHCRVLQLVINEVSDSSPQALQAVKLLAQYFGEKIDKVRRRPRLPLCIRALVKAWRCSALHGSLHPVTQALRLYGRRRP